MALYEATARQHSTGFSALAAGGCPDQCQATPGGNTVVIIDLHGFVNHIRDHVSDHGFHVHDLRHFVETYSNRQTWEMELHPDNACGGPLDLVLTVEAEARVLSAFEDEVEKVGPDAVPSKDITVPMMFGFMLPPVLDSPDLLVLATNLAGIGGTELPLQVSALNSYEAVSDRPECTINIVGRVDLPLADVYERQDLPCDLLDRAHAICEFLLDRAPAWLDDF